MAGYTYYQVMENVAVDGTAGWNYPNSDEYFARHSFYACDYYRYVYIKLNSYPL